MIEKNAENDTESRQEYHDGDEEDYRPDRHWDTGRATGRRPAQPGAEQKPTKKMYTGVNWIRV